MKRKGKTQSSSNPRSRQPRKQEKGLLKSIATVTKPPESTETKSSIKESAHLRTYSSQSNAKPVVTKYPAKIGPNLAPKDSPYHEFLNFSSNNANVTTEKSNPSGAIGQYEFPPPSDWDLLIHHQVIKTPPPSPVEQEDKREPREQTNLEPLVEEPVATEPMTESEEGRLKQEPTDIKTSQDSEKDSNSSVRVEEVTDSNREKMNEKREPGKKERKHETEDRESSSVVAMDATPTRSLKEEPVLNSYPVANTILTTSMSFAMHQNEQSRAEFIFPTTSPAFNDRQEEQNANVKRKENTEQNKSSSYEEGMNKDEKSACGSSPSIFDKQNQEKPPSRPMTRSRTMSKEIKQQQKSSQPKTLEKEEGPPIEKRSRRSTATYRSETDNPSSSEVKHSKRRKLNVNEKENEFKDQSLVSDLSNTKGSQVIASTTPGSSSKKPKFKKTFYDDHEVEEYTATSESEEAESLSEKQNDEIDIFGEQKDDESDVEDLFDSEFLSEERENDDSDLFQLPQRAERPKRHSGSTSEKRERPQDTKSVLQRRLERRRERNRLAARRSRERRLQYIAELESINETLQEKLTQMNKKIEMLEQQLSHTTKSERGNTKIERARKGVIGGERRRKEEQLGETGGRKFTKRSQAQ